MLNQKFCTLSKGEQTKVLLAMMFLKENNYLLIDEPTNHLDTFARKSLANYLKNKKSFILVSHDRALLDEVVDHILAILRKPNFERDQFDKDLASYSEGQKKF